MKNSCTAERLKYLIENRNIRQVDILELCKPYCLKYSVKMNKSDLSQYLSGKTEPNQDKLVVLSMALNVNEAWLMGYDVPMEKEEQQSMFTDRNRKPPDEDNRIVELTVQDERDIAKRLESALADLEFSQEALMFSGEPLDDETRELLKISLENSIRIAKISAKQKFTPKKHRKSSKE